MRLQRNCRNQAITLKTPPAGSNECNGDVSPTKVSRRLLAILRTLRGASTRRQITNLSGCEDTQKTHYPRSPTAPEPHRENPQRLLKWPWESAVIPLEKQWRWPACIYPQFAERLSCPELSRQIPQSRNCHSGSTAKIHRC